MKRFLSILTLVCAAVLGVSAGFMSPERQKQVTDSLRAALGTASSIEDSVHIYTNLFDVAPVARQAIIADSVYRLAERAGDSQTAFDIIRNIANRKQKNDSVLRTLRKRAYKWPDSEDRKETILFIDMMDNINKGRHGTTAERDSLLKKVVDDISNSRQEGDEDLYERIRQLHAVCMLLSHASNSELLGIYSDSLGSLVRRLPASAYAVRNAYCIHAAVAFAGIDPDKSIECDRRILSMVSKLEQQYKERGRPFRDYSPTYYTVYSRLLSNYENLTPAQIEDYYRRVKKLVASDPSIAATYKKFPRAEIYYALYKQDWKKAADLINSSEFSEVQNYELYKRLVQCAEALGDEDMREKAALKYAGVLEEELNARESHSFRELQIAYAIHDMKYRLYKLDQENVKNQSKLQLYILFLSVIASAILSALVILLFNKSRSNKALAQRLAESNEQLRNESESLRVSREDLIRAKAQAEKANNLKSDFIKNMSYEVKVPLQAITEYSRLIADCVQSTGAKHIARFADMLELNTELLTTIVDDVLRLSDIESSPMPVHPQVVNLRSFCSATIEAIRRRVQPGVTLRIDPEVEDMDLFTDPTRVQQILNNLLNNAAKFTSKGTITLGYRHIPGKEEVEFYVTDTGIGINPENKEKIFQRFTKLDHDTQGAGLGLTIARIIAQRLGGRLELDTTYPGPGSRFVLILPKK